MNVRKSHHKRVIKFVKIGNNPRTYSKHAVTIWDDVSAVITIKLITRVNIAQTVSVC